MSHRNHVLGIDIGSISIAIAEINDNKEIIKTSYSMHEGNILENLSEILSTYNLSEIGGIAVTSATPEIFKTASAYDSRVSFIKAAKHLNDQVGSILIVGGEKFGLISFDEQGEYQNYKSNTSCAAGTGSFLDQQAKRLNLSGIEEFSKVAYNNTGDIPKIASRCAVFAKTDLIHAQQEGYTLAEICDGLSHGLSKNICDTLFTDTNINTPLLFVGGVSKNDAVKKHISNIVESEIITDEHSQVYGAIGSAINFLEEEKLNENLNIEKPEDILVTEKKEKKYHYDPLKLNFSTYPDFNSLKKYEYTSKLFKLATPVEIDIYEDLSKKENYSVYLGIDIGSTSTKATIVDENKNVLIGFYTRTSGRPLEAVQTIFESIDDICQNENISFNYSAVGTTGSGRKFIGQIIGGDIALDEITAHARAAYELNEDVDTIIEIGGQDAKFTTLKNGMVTFSIMNNVCAAGTGSFIEEQAKKLSCPLKDYSSRAESVQAPLSSDRCTVFMERDLNYYLSEGYHVNEVLASVLHSVRENYLSKVAIEGNIGDKIFFQGATAKNQALVAAFEQKLGKPIMVSKFCHLTGALGVALHLLDNHNEQTTFRGIDLYKQNIPIRSEVCELCTNHCKVKIADVNNEIAAFGFLCGRDYETKSFVNQNTSGFDLLKERQKAFAFKKSTEYKEDITIGIPATLHLFEDLTLWRKFFDLLSIKTITSENFKDGIKSGKQLTGAEFCAPMSNLHGHVDYLKEKSDYIFLPEYLEKKQKDKNIRRQYCYYTQFAQPVVSSVEKITNNSKILAPLIRSIQGNFHMKTQLYLMIKKITKSNISFIQVSNAYDKALKFQNTSLDNLKDTYSKLSKENDDINVVLLGRPYTVLSKSMNNGITDIFSKLGIKTFFQDMVPYEAKDIQAITPLLKAFHWNYGAKILEAAEVIAKDKNAYPVFVTSFKCTPDSFVIEYFKDVLEAYNKPYLILQLDEHDSSVGYETRIEAGIRAFRNHFNSKSEIKELAESQISANPDVTYKKSIFEGKTLLLPNWDEINSKLVQAQLISDGIDARVLEETNESIQRSLQHNTGQCIPLNSVAQSTMEYIEKYNLDPENTVLWMFDSSISCNVRMYPYYIKKILESKGNGFEKVAIYVGELTFKEMSYSTAINIYFAHMFGGLIRKIGCKLRPHEKIKGSTDLAIKRSVEILYATFLACTSKEDALEKIVSLFENIEVDKTEKPKVALFGDLYVRDNSVMNQNLISMIEENGGEVITTPYNEYLKIIADPYIKKWFNEGLYADVAQAKILQKAILLMEKKYYKYFDRILKEPEFKVVESPEKILSKLNIKIEHTGESMDNVLKIHSMTNHYKDISLFVQTNPAFCCPSLVTEAMASQIEKITGIPIVTIEYDGTGGSKNDDIIPYLKYPRQKIKKTEDKEEAEA